MQEIQASNAALFSRLLSVSGLLIQNNWRYRKLVAKGYMPLSIDKLNKSEDGSIRFSLAHNSELNGDIMADPDMEIVYVPGPIPHLVAKTFQNDYAGKYTSVDDVVESRREAVQRDLDGFLNLWLRNLLDQGHKWDGYDEEKRWDNLETNSG